MVFLLLQDYVENGPEIINNYWTI